MQREFIRYKEPSRSFSVFIEYSEEVIKKYRGHPYIKTINKNCIIFKTNFYDETYKIYEHFSINKILEIYKIDSNDFCKYTLSIIEQKYRTYIDTKNEKIKITKEQIVFERKKQKLLEDVIESNFQFIKAKLKEVDKYTKKEIYKIIKAIPKDLDKKYTLKYMLKKLEISKSSFYDVLNNKKYLQYYKEKAIQDEKDIKVIKQILEHYDYPLGTRMMYMQLRLITNKKFSRKKIQRLYKKYNIDCNVRKNNKTKSCTMDFVVDAVKPNILQRKFKLAKPLTNLLTDVTYLFFNNHKAYLSVIKDSVTGKILSCVVSMNNNAQLALDTLSYINKNKLNKNAIFHSDQGTIYFSAKVQLEIERKEMIQSMSRRGNCWDNASVETFFGHLKSECNYSNCNDINEVRKVINSYIHYYNNLRPQWNRNKMTPNMYEKYLLNLSKIEYEKYLNKETVKYDIMVSNAKERIIASARKNKKLRMKYEV